MIINSNLLKIIQSLYVINFKNYKIKLIKIYVSNSNTHIN